MDVPFWVWALTVVVILGMLVFDFVGHVRTPHAPTLRESAIWSAVYVGIAVRLRAARPVVIGAEFGGEYFAGYIAEKSLSVDNLFVFVLIMASFAVPAGAPAEGADVRHRARAGAADRLHPRRRRGHRELQLSSSCSARLLVYTLAQARTAVTSATRNQENAIVRLARRVLPTTEDVPRRQADRQRRRQARRHAAVHRVDRDRQHRHPLRGRLDPGGLRGHPGGVHRLRRQRVRAARPAAAVLPVDGLLDRLVYLSYGLALILGFIGVKLIIHALHTNELPFINGGEHVDRRSPRSARRVSLAVILATWSSRPSPASRRTGATGGPRTTGSRRARRQPLHH